MNFTFKMEFTLLDLEFTFKINMEFSFKIWNLPYFKIWNLLLHMEFTFNP